MRLIWALALALFAAVAPAHAQPSPNLEGVWATEIVRAPVVRGTLTVQREGSSWRAALGDVSQGFEVRGERIEFSLPGNTGAKTLLKSSFSVSVIPIAAPAVLQRRKGQNKSTASLAGFSASNSAKAISQNTLSSKER